jgi:hypothetical protein
LVPSRRGRHKAVDLDGVGARDLDGIELLVGDDEVVTPGDLVAAASVLRSDRRAGLFIDQLLAQTIAGGLVDLPECNALAVEHAACRAIGQETRASLR